MVIKVSEKSKKGKKRKHENNTKAKVVYKYYHICTFVSLAYITYQFEKDA